MPRIAPYPHANATGARKELMDAVQSQFGGVVNMFGTVAHSPAALKSMLGAFGALAEGRLDARRYESYCQMSAGDTA